MDTSKFLSALLATIAMGPGATVAMAQAAGQAPGAQPASSQCRPVVPAPQARARAGKPPWRPAQRLALIEDGAVPCVHQDTGEAATCRFRLGSPGGPQRASGHWLAGEDGRHYALAGQPIARDGRRAGDHVIAARVVDGAVPCVDIAGAAASTIRGTQGVPIGEELVGACIVETIGASTNRTGQPLRNVATRRVCTRTHPHPDGARLVSANRRTGVYCYIGEGAGLNDPHGKERDAKGNYLPGCHVLWNSGLEVFAAKRPAIRGYPKRVDTKSELVWRQYVRRPRMVN